MEIIVVGERGSGKTTVLNRIKKLLEGECAPFGKEWTFSEVTTTVCEEQLKRLGLVRQSTEVSEEYTGGSSSYYMLTVLNPTTLEDPYDCECNDIIEALQMTYAEGNAFKAIWRSCAARLGKRKKGYDKGLYDAEKVEFFGNRMKVIAQNAAKESN